MEVNLHSVPSCLSNLTIGLGGGWYILLWAYLGESTLEENHIADLRSVLNSQEEKVRKGQNINECKVSKAYQHVDD